MPGAQRGGRDPPPSLGIEPEIGFSRVVVRSRKNRCGRGGVAALRRNSLLELGWWVLVLGAIVGLETVAGLGHANSRRGMIALCRLDVGVEGWIRGVRFGCWAVTL